MFEKLDDSSKNQLEGLPFTQISNNVIHFIKSPDAFLVWCYLYSKSSNWKVIKQNIKNVYGFGDKKIKQIFSYLQRAKLIKYIQPKSVNGVFQKVEIQVLNGTKFDKNQPFAKESPVGHKTGRAVNRTSRNDELLNKDIYKTKKKTEGKNKSYAVDNNHDAKIQELDKYGLDGRHVFNKFLRHLKSKGKKYFSEEDIITWFERELDYTNKKMAGINKKLLKNHFEIPENKIDDSLVKADSKIARKHLEAISKLLSAKKRVG